MLLRARSVIPVAAPPVEDGAVLVCGERIAAVGRWQDVRSEAPGTVPVMDLGEVALVPGWVNAHCHLDYTGFAAHLPPPRSFTDWIKGVLALKAGWSFSEYAASWLTGARQLLAAGCTSVLDIEAVPELLPDAWSGTPMRVISALEMTGVRSGRPAVEIVGAAEEVAVALADHPRNRIAFSPHAPYSTRPDLLAEAVRVGRRGGRLLTIHVAESEEEFEMFRHARGAMHGWLRTQRGDGDCGGHTPIQHVAAAGLVGPDCVLVHANCLEPGDVELLGRTGTHVVHCPRSHEYFGHPPFPFAQLRAAGVNVCLGTDSLLSVARRGQKVPRLDPFAEMAVFAEHHPGVAPAEILALSTRNAARALGWGGVLGELSVGARADLIAVPVPASGSELEAAVIHGHPPVAGVLIHGRWEVPPPGVNLPEAEAS